MPRRHAAQGFSLVEMMIVIGLFGMLVAISVPSLQGYMRSNRLDTQSDRLTSDLALARSFAVARGRILHFAATTTGYTITDTGTAETVRQHNFDGDVALAANVDADFFPWGAASTATLSITNGCDTRILNLLPTGIVEVGP